MDSGKLFAEERPRRDEQKHVYLWICFVQLSSRGAATTVSTKLRSCSRITFEPAHPLRGGGVSSGASAPHGQSSAGDRPGKKVVPLNVPFLGHSPQGAPFFPVRTSESGARRFPGAAGAAQAQTASATGGSPGGQSPSEEPQRGRRPPPTGSGGNPGAGGTRPKRTAGTAAAGNDNTDHAQNDSYSYGRAAR